MIKAMEQITKFKKDVINWLLEEDNPPVRYLTQKNLLQDMKAAEISKNHLMDYAVTRTILDHLADFQALDNKSYWKYKGKYWQLIFLGQYLADGSDPAVAQIAGSILAHRKWRWSFGGQCLWANILGALMRLGYNDHPGVLEETENLARMTVKDGRLNCDVMTFSLLPQCYMAIPKVLHCFAEIPNEKRSAAVRQAIDILVRILLDNEIFIYVPGSRGEWLKIMEQLPKRSGLPENETVKARTLAQKEKFLAAHGLGEREEKPGWSKFGFPLHYNSDILEAMTALARLQVPVHPNMEKALRVIEEKMTPGGTWKLQNSLNGKMWVDVEKKGQPSKWITYFALYVLDHYGRLTHCN